MVELITLSFLQTPNPLKELLKPITAGARVLQNVKLAKENIDANRFSRVIPILDQV